MNRGFWDKLPKPFFALAPMADVTDAVFRRVVAECNRLTPAKKAGPDVMFTEFVAADGLMHPVGRKKLLIDLKYSEIERPIVAQIWGGKPENIEGAAKLVRDLGFDGLDINMGCPDRGVEKQGGGAGLIRQHDLAREIIEAATKGADPLPVSVKTRIGYDKIDFEWLKMLMSSGIAALTLHLRTRKEMSKVPAHWELLGQLCGRVPVLTPSDIGYANMASRRGQDSTTKLASSYIIGNGDVLDLADAREKAVRFGADGVMLGRAIFGNPWLFSKRGKPEWSEVFSVMIYHSRLFEEIYVGVKSFALMRKFFGAYVSGHPQASTLRDSLMKCNNAREVEVVLGPMML